MMFDNDAQPGFDSPHFDVIDAPTKEWIDARVSWIVHQFGADRVRTC